MPIPNSPGRRKITEEAFQVEILKKMSLARAWASTGKLGAISD